MNEHPEYRISETYQGRHAVVFRAIRLVDETPVILKRLRDDRQQTEELSRFQREFSLSRQIQLPCKVAVLALERHGGSQYLVLEDFGGVSLDRALTKRAWSLAERLHLAIQMADILNQIHAAGIIHRDITLSHFLWNEHTEELKLTDFGLALTLPSESTSFQHPGRLEGTLAYMSPEQTGRMNQPLDYRTDLYSFGCVLYELFTGRPPFVADNPLDMVHAHLALQAMSLHEVSVDVPPVLSDIVLKLLRKEREERYQNAFGVRFDLHICLDRLHADGVVKTFPLGEQDMTSRFQIPHKLYGRDEEIRLLLDGYERASRGPAELLLVAGYSGVGKSSLVHEIHRPITSRKGYFAEGKFNQYQRNIPYTAVRQTLSDFCRYVLTEDHERLQRWKMAILDAVGTQGRVLIEVIPALELIIGPQPAVEALSPLEAQLRFGRLFRKLLAVIGRPEHPLVVFIDDWQWADPASIQLLQQLLAGGELRHVLFICAYRDNEVEASHPFMRAVNELRQQRVAVQLLGVGNLKQEDLAHLVADTVRQEPRDVASLVQMVHEKTQGNPFFTRMFLTSLHEEGLLTFDHALRRWRWEIPAIQQKGYTDNVVEMLIGRIRRFDAETRRVLSLAACVGDRFDLQTLSITSDLSPGECLDALWPAVDAGLALPVDETYHLAEDAAFAPRIQFRFLHDRVQQSAYSLIPTAERSNVHLRIGTRLLGQMSPELLAERLFEVTDHLNVGRALIGDPSRQVELIALNLEAARKAKAAIAYGAARHYHLAAADILVGAGLTEGLWADHYSLALALFKEHSEIEYLNGHFDTAEKLLRQAFQRARKPIDQADVLHGLIVQYTLLAKYPEAIGTGRQALRALGVELPRREYETARDQEIALVLEALGERQVTSLFDLPVMSDREKQMVARLLITMGPPCYRSHPRLWSVIVPKVVNLCLQYGNIPQVGYSHTAFGGLLGYVHNDYSRAIQFGELATRLMTETFISPSDQSVFYLMIGSSLRHWTRPLQAATQDYRQAYLVGLSSGNLQYAAYAFGHNMYCRFYQGTPLDELYRETEESLNFSQSRRNQWAIDLLEGGLLIFGTLTGTHNRPFSRAALTEQELLRRCEANGNRQIVCIYLVLKALTQYLHGDFEQALATSLDCEPRIPTVATQGLLPWAEHLFTHLLILAALYRDADDDRRREFLGRLQQGLEQLRVWARFSPENFEHKSLLVAAEIAGIEGRVADALDLYDRAIALAHDAGFLQCAAMANACAGRFWLSRDKDPLAQLYLRRARDLFASWGAQAVVQSLELRYSDLVLQTDRMQGGGAISTISSLKDLDVTTLLEAAQTLSETVQLEPLLRKLIHLVQTHAGAESAILLMAEGESWRVQAQGNSLELSVLQNQPLDPRQLPLSVLRYAIRTREILLLDHPAMIDGHAPDPYLQHVQPKSVCCLPLLHRGEMVAMLYLENRLAGGVFTVQQMKLLGLLSSLMASAIVNGLIYDDLDSAVRQRTAELERITYTISHDLKSPLVTVKTFLGFLQQDIAENDAERIAKDVGFMNSACDKMMALLEELLEMMRIGRVVNTPLRVSYTEVVQEAIALVAGRIADRQVALQVSESALMLFGDRPRLVEIWQNLLDNAVKYMGNQSVPMVEVGAEGNGESTIFFVRDNGMGIGPDFQEKVFGLFERLNTGIEGTGLGLALVRRIVELYGGRIWIESAGAGQGCSFRFTLPAAIQTPVAAPTLS